MELLFTALIVLSHFDPYLPKLADYETKSKPDLVQMYSDACLNLFTHPEFKDLDIQELLQTILSSVPTSQNQTIRDKVDIARVIDLYKKICKPQPEFAALWGMDNDIAEAQLHYKQLTEEVQAIRLTEFERLKQATEVIAANGELVTEIYQPSNRRKSIDIKTLPGFIPKGFVAVEDRRFFEHPGTDEIGILRAFLKSFMSKGRPEGGSTITQQVARNLFLDNSLSFDRKLKEILIADKLEDMYSKEQILQVYMNLIYFGRNSWGIEKAAQSYFGKPASKLTIPETAYLVGIVQGPNLYQSNPARIEARTNFVLTKFAEAGIISEPSKINIANDLKFVKDQTSVNSNYFRDYLLSKIQEAKSESILNSGMQIQSTLNKKLQEVSEEALQAGLIAYEKNAGRYIWKGPLTNIANELVKSEIKLNTEVSGQAFEKSKSEDSLFGSIEPSDEVNSEVAATDAPLEINMQKYWATPLQAVSRTQPPPAKSWEICVALNTFGKIGFINGTDGFLTQKSLEWAAPIKFGDVFYVTDSGNDIYEIVQAPDINGAVVAMDPRTGAVLAMVGGFSYNLSPWNRAVLAYRQPGSLVKPFTYMAALQQNIQPNTLLDSTPMVFPPTSRGGQSWAPKNYENASPGPMPMRWALEKSINTMTAYLMSKVGLDPIRNLMKSFGLYQDPTVEYPIILGSEEANLLTLVKVYGEIANAGKVIEPRIIKPNAQLPSTLSSIAEQNPTSRVQGIDEISLFQIRYLLQGVTQSGTGARLHKISEFVAGKTGTSDELNDVWFVGFTPNLVIGAYVGYDEPQSLGGRSSGGSVALPIVQNILNKSFKIYKKEEPFPGPPPGIVFKPTDKTTGNIEAAETGNTVMEAYRAN